MPRLLTVLLLATLTACDRAPESYPPPEQRHPVDGPNPGESSMMIDLSDPDAPAHYLKDIEEGDGSWRWTGQRPTLKIFVFTKDHLKLSADFTLWETALQQTGPVQLTFFVNDRPLDKIRYSEPGYGHFEKPVPSDWLTPDSESTVAIAIDKLYTAPQDGKKFGLILSRMGFEQQ